MTIITFFSFCLTILHIYIYIYFFFKLTYQDIKTFNKNNGKMESLININKTKDNKLLMDGKGVVGLYLCIYDKENSIQILK